MFRLIRSDAASRSTRRRTSVTDHEFGEIKFKRSTTSRHVRVRLMPDGKLYATLPRRAPLYAITQLVDESRDELRQLMTQAGHRRVYHHLDRIGQSHTLIVEQATEEIPKVSVKKQLISVTLPESWVLEEAKSQECIRKACAKALRREAEAYLPRRLRHLADLYGYQYASIRFGNPKGRWGSYSSSGTVSLNIALMNLPQELIDYVLIHELCHSEHPHHQAVFWEAVAEAYPDYRTARRQLREYSPYL